MGPEIGEVPIRHRIPFYKDWILIPIIGLVYVIDQLTKYWVDQELCYYRAIPKEGPFQLTCTLNTGTAFGLFQDYTSLLILASFLGIGVLLVVYQHHPAPGLLLRTSLGLQLGGAVGNLTDRLRFGAVTDFVKLGPWPVFNLADACIVVGLITLIWLFFFPGTRANGINPGRLDGSTSGQYSLYGQDTHGDEGALEQEQLCDRNED